MKKSRLPEMPTAMLDAKSESPIATTRLSGFRSESAEAGVALPDGGGGVTVAGAETAAPSVIGPCLSPLSALKATSALPVESDARSASDQLCALVFTSGCAVCVFDPPSIGAIDRAIGNAVMTR